MPMVQVRPRSLRRSRSASRSEREVQGILPALGSEFVTVDESVAIFRHGESPTSSSSSSSASKPRRRPAKIEALPYRKVLATWPDAWRERWGRLANQIEDQGVSWRDAESRAFVEVWSRYRVSADPLRN